MFSNILHYFLSIGESTTDTEELKLKKKSLVLVPIIIGPAAFIWGIIYIYLNHYISASIPLFYSIISILNLMHLQKTKNIIVLQKVQMILVLILPFLLMWSLGGFAKGSFVFIWSFYAPIASLTYEKKQHSLYWFYSFASLVLLSVFLDGTLMKHHLGCMNQNAIGLFYFLNITAGLSGIYFLVQYFIGEKDKNAHKLLEEEHKALKSTTLELQKVNKELNHLACHDNLTGLANRYLLRTNLSKMIALAARQEHVLALLFLDLDGFKNINDRYGHAIGDEVLKTVANRIKPLLRKEDTMARIGGDEFAIAIGNITDINLVNQISQRILDEVVKKYECIPGDNSLGISIGIAFFPRDASDIDGLINKADEAMYGVKVEGKHAFKTYN